MADSLEICQSRARTYACLKNRWRFENSVWRQSRQLIIWDSGIKLHMSNFIEKIDTFKGYVVIIDISAPRCPSSLETRD